MDVGEGAVGVEVVGREVLSLHGGTHKELAAGLLVPDGLDTLNNPAFSGPWLEGEIILIVDIDTIKVVLDGESH